MYSVLYDEDGVPAGISRMADGACIPFSDQNMDFRAFLDWNAQQPAPLDWQTPIDPPDRKLRRWEAVREERVRRLIIADRAGQQIDDRFDMGLISSEQRSEALYALAQFRQALRDLPELQPDPFDLTWPTPDTPLLPFIPAVELAILTAEF